MPTPRIIAINGSTRKASTNRQLIEAIIELSGSTFTIDVYEKLDQLPHFNPDLDTDQPPEAVTEFRHALRASDGILICTPEYAMGVPGTLKNSIDWTVSSMEFSKKPTALITASSLGHKSHQSLLDTLQVIEARMTDASQLVIPHVRVKVKDSRIVDDQTLASVQRVMDELQAMIKDGTY